MRQVQVLPSSWNVGLCGKGRSKGARWQGPSVPPSEVCILSSVVCLYVSSGRMTPIYCHSVNLSSNSRKEPERLRNPNREGWFEGGENVPAKLGWKDRDPTFDPGRKVRPWVCFSDIWMNGEDSCAPRQWNNSCFPGRMAPWSQLEQTLFPGKNCNMLITKCVWKYCNSQDCMCLLVLTITSNPPPWLA